jgi:hypothetical protein
VCGWDAVGVLIDQQLVISAVDRVIQHSGGPWRRRQPDGRPHGLDVVEALTGPDSWGAETTTGGDRIVWARLDLDAAGE